MSTLKAILLPLLAATFLAASFPSAAEVVNVKYRGSVDLASFQCATPSSSFVHRICYQASTCYVVLRLQNTYYHYCRVPESVIRNWLSAPSVGQFFKGSIKGRYDCRAGGILD